ncbi:MAG: hypothetical protein ACM3Q9_01200 [Methanosarcina sp.]
MTGGRGRSAAIALGLALLAFLAPAAAAEAPTRPEYVARLEQICKPGYEATLRAVRGVRQEVRAEHLPAAAPKVAKAKRIFARTVRTIGRVPRPSEDRATLGRWFTGLQREIRALDRTAAALRADDVARFERVWADFIHEGNKANNVVVSFGFNYCSFKPTRFQ